MLSSLALLAGGCRPTTTRASRPPVDAGTVRFELDYAHMPEAPAGLPTAVADVWQALRDGDAPRAQQLFSELSEQQAGSAAVYTLAGYLALSRRSIAAAQEAFEHALAAASDYAPALYGTGVATEVSGERMAAVQWYRRALQVDAAMTAAAVRVEILELQEAQSLLANGETVEASGSREAAIEAYQEAIRLGPRLLGAYLRLADLYQQGGDEAGAVRVLRQARDRVGDVPQVLEPLGLALQRADAYADAFDIFQRLQELVPDDPRVRNMAAEARRLYETTSLPEPYRQLEEVPVIHRGDLAALLAIRIPGLAKLVEAPREGIIMTDIEDSWAAPYIRKVARLGIMEAWQNHAFYPKTEVSRQMFAEVIFRVLDIIGATEGAPRPELRDIPHDHYFYQQIQMVVGRGILPLKADGSFGVLERVSGAEAVAAVQRLARLARARGV
ncbi:MAG: S-layer homology domain-containing protein [Acidobacteriota bacterium]